MVEENIINKYSRKIQFYPSQAHICLLDKCFGATRYLVNQALERINKGEITQFTSAISIRENLRYQDKYLTPETMWLKEVPYDTRDEAIRQLASNFRTNFTLLRKKIITHFSMKFKSKHNDRQTCFINKKALNLDRSTLFLHRIKDRLKFHEDVSSYKNHGTLTVTRENGRYYMCFSLNRESRTFDKPHKTVSLDPGVKTFQTFYSPDGVAGKIGDVIARKLKNKLILEDKLKGFLSTLKGQRKKRHNMKKRCSLLRTKVKNIVVDLHRKTCSFLTRNFDTVLLPSFDVKKMINKKDRKIGKQSVRSMLALSHFKFKQRLLEMGETNCCKVIICDESYTSMTCGRCGELNRGLGGARVYNCKSCHLVVDRDYNGARNIYIKNVHLIPST
jgi:putative transposase